MNTSSLPPVLVVEDSIEDFVAFSRIFRKLALPNPVVRCEDGGQALDYLLGEHKFPGWPARLPALVLLDLNMPGIDGREVLGVLKKNARLQPIPVVVFSTSARPQDIQDSYLLGANSYMVKPMEYGQLEEKIRLIVSYWLGAGAAPQVP